MNKRLLLLALVPFLFVPYQSSAQRPLDRGDLSLRHEIQRAIDKGLAWLVENQADEGHWSTPDHPAVSALALVAFQGDQDAERSAREAQAVRRGYQFVTGSAQPDGGIYRKNELVNYNTAVSLMALLAAEKAEYKPLILKARQFLIGLQWDFGEKGELDTPLDGGIGYGSSYKHSDMSNTLLALEALYYSKQALNETELRQSGDLDWNAVIHFIERCQNLPSHNPEPWASDDPANKGGFIYFPGDSKAGETNLANGRVALRSYGSISYAGLLSYIHADLDRDDPRVQAVVDWLEKNYTLEENPGMGPQGLYYYYHTMAKALASYGTRTLTTDEGRTVDWRKDLALQLINLQKPDGSWMNDNGRWWERDPALVTAYTVIALEMILRQL